MNILVITNSFPKNYDAAIVSGVVKNGFNHALALAEHGHCVSVITDGKRAQYSLRGVRVHAVGKGRFKGVLKAFWLDLLVSIKVIQLRKSKFSYIHIHTGNLLLLYTLKRIGLVSAKIIYSAHGTTTPELTSVHKERKGVIDSVFSINTKIQEWIDGVMWRYSDLVVSSSAHQINEMADIYKVSRDHMVTIHNGYDSSLFKQDQDARQCVRKKLGVTKETNVILFVGRLTEKKGAHLLLKSVSAVADVHKVHFVFILGNQNSLFDSSYREKLRAELNHANERISVFENVPEKDMCGFYNAADICVFPSIGYESFPTVIYEAMACGKPVVTQGSWGVREVIHEYLLTETEIKTELSSRLISLLNQPDTLKENGQENQNRVTAFSWYNVASKHIEAYKKLKS